LPSQARPEAVQKSAAFAPPAQHCWVAPPHDEHAPLVQVPRLEPHVEPDATHVVPAQHAPPLQVEFSQHGCPAPPQAVSVPATQSWPVELLPPGATQAPVAASRHAPLLHVVPPHAG
jgi:hypothetical protein